MVGCPYSPLVVVDPWACCVCPSRPSRDCTISRLRRPRTPRRIRDSDPVDDLGFVDLVAGVVGGCQAGGVAHGTVGIDHPASASPVRATRCSVSHRSGSAQPPGASRQRGDPQAAGRVEAEDSIASEISDARDEEEKTRVGRRAQPPTLLVLVQTGRDRRRVRRCCSACECERLGGANSDADAPVPKQHCQSSKSGRRRLSQIAQWSRDVGRSALVRLAIRSALGDQTSDPRAEG